MILNILTDKISNHEEVMHLLERIDTPLRRMDDGLKYIHDDLQGRYTNKSNEQLLNVYSIPTHGSFEVAFTRTIHTTSQAS